MDDALSRLAHSVGKTLRGAKRSFDRRIGRTDQPHLVPYRGYGNNSRMVVMGRALRDPGLSEATRTDNWWRNLLNSYKRIETDELRGARVRVSFMALSQELIADDEGFFRATLPLSTPPAPEADFWQRVSLDLIEPAPRDAEVRTTVAMTLIPPEQADFGIISDLDDTVIQTGSTNVLRMVRSVLLGNVHTRVPFAGVADFYAALQQGSTGTGFNPIFYVSSSPWNLYDIVEQFLALQRIPMGPVLLRDWGAAVDRIPFGHASHKLSAIRHIMDMYPQLPFVLIGDSGQQDPEIYREVVREYPRRVLAAYIRNVTASAARAQSLRVVAEEVKAAGSELVIVAETDAAAQHAAASGWISGIPHLH